MAEALKGKNGIVCSECRTIETESPINSKCQRSMNLEDSSASEIIEIAKGLKIKSISALALI